LFFAQHWSIGWIGPATVAGWAQPGPVDSTETALHAVHDALFASFLTGGRSPQRSQDNRAVDSGAGWHLAGKPVVHRRFDN
jgi:hypothetical protein